MLKRRSKIPMASGRDGISGTSINRILDGMWVKTIVLIKPIFQPLLLPIKPMPAKIFGKEKDTAQNARVHTEADVEPIGDHALYDQPACKGIQGE
jgi:hypothetical protein